MDPEYSTRLLDAVRPAASDPGLDHQTVLHTAYAAIVEGNFDAFGESVTDDIELHISGFAPMNGAWRGRDEVLAATRKNFAHVKSQQPHIEGMIAQGDRIAVLLRESGVFASSGQPYTLRGVQWFTFSNGKIKRIDEIVAIGENPVDA